MKMIKLFAIAAVMTGLLASCGAKEEAKKDGKEGEKTEEPAAEEPAAE